MRDQAVSHEGEVRREDQRRRGEEREIRDGNRVPRFNATLHPTIKREALSVRRRRGEGDRFDQV